MADQATIWALDSLLEAGMYGARTADTEDQFAAHTFEAVQVCARRILQSDTDMLTFHDPTQNEDRTAALKQVLDKLDTCEDSIKAQARVWYCSFTEDDVRRWKAAYQELPTRNSTTTRSRTSDASRSDTDSFDPYGMR